ncbi:MAG: tRNA (adenosine(37)-N6)-dimethylallyltransferase MiaA [Bacteroidota bacterium]
MKNNLIIIAGPTAVGKTTLSIQLAKHYSCPIVSADSRQFYKEMEIGTAKPSISELEEVPHFFINNKSINDVYNIGEYEKEASTLIDQLFIENELIILVGGSGLYIQALINGLDEFEEIPKYIRTNLINQYQEKGILFLQEELKLRDNKYFEEVDINNPHRLIRALEVCIYKGKPFSEYRTNIKKERNFNAIPILINTSRTILYEQINKRVDKMIKSGLLEEAKALFDQRHLNALNTVGYKELFLFLEDKISFPEAIEKIKRNTRRYAKRQLTWFNHQGNFETFEPTELEKIISYIDIIIKQS